MPTDAHAQRRRKAFQPVNTLSSPKKPQFQSAKELHLLLADWVDDQSAMVRERSPSRTLFVSPQKRDRQPLANISAKMQSPNQRQSTDGEKTKEQSGGVEFGKASPLRNPLKKSSPSIFIPKNRPPTKPSSSSLSGQQHNDRQFKTNSNLPQDAFAIPVPTNPQPKAIHPPPRPTYSSSTAGMNPYATYVPPRQVIDLTQPKPRNDDSDDDGENWDPDAEIRANSARFGAPDPYMYMDSHRADEDMKKLLEAAFDDEAEKGKTRLRSRVKKVEKMQEEDTKTKSLANKLAALSVKAQDETKAGAEEEEEEEDGTIDGLSVKLLPHQVEGVSWMIDKEVGRNKTRGILPKGGILADDMGLGKTVQSVALMLTNPRPALEAKPEFKGQKLPGKEVGKGTLVVAPLALIKQWESEIKTKVNKSHAMKVLVHHGSNRTKNSADLKKYDVVITTYQTLTSEHAGSNMNSEYGARIGCFGVHWYRLMLDEAHSIKNRNAKSTQACCALNSWYRWCLTGTPMQNNLDELQSLIHFLQIKPFCEYPRWKHQIIQPMKSGRGGLAMQRVQVFLKAFMKRRTKDILKKDGALNFGGKSATGEDGEAKNGGMQIVKREVLTVECQFDPEEKQYYDRLQARADKRLEQMMESKGNADYIGALVLLLRLRQLCDHPQLIEQAMAKDKDAMTTGVPSGKRSAKDEGDEMDALTALMGGVTVEAKNCDVCQIKLTAAESQEGMVRCTECEADLKAMKKRSSNKQKKAKGKHRKSKARSSRHVETVDDSEVVDDAPKSRRTRNRKVVIDSDDEDEEGGGEWIVGKHARNARQADADNSDDEDEEGGGETLDTIDSERSDEDDSQISDSPSRARMMKVVSSDNDTADSGDEDESQVDTSRPRRRKMKVVNSDSETEDSGDDEEEADGSETEESEDDDGAESDQSGLLEGMNHFSKPKHAPSTKIRQLLRILHTETPKHKTIVFSQFTTMLDLIEPHLRHADIRFVRYDGSMRPDAREQSLNSLRNDKKTRVLLCSLKCGSLGLNLTAASRVVIVEPFWNPFVEEQAIDRVHRLNQTVDVKVFRLTIRETVEERILSLQEKKRELANAAIEGGGKGMGNLSMKDILGLFRPDAENTEHANDRKYWAKFGDDNRLLDGPANVSATDHVRDLADVYRPMPKAPVQRRAEDPVYGRRW